MMIQIRPRRIDRSVFQVFRAVEYAWFEAILIVESYLRFLTIFAKNKCQEMAIIRDTRLYYGSAALVQQHWHWFSSTDSAKQHWFSKAALVQQSNTERAKQDSESRALREQSSTDSAALKEHLDSLSPIGMEICPVFLLLSNGPSIV